MIVFVDVEHMAGGCLSLSNACQLCAGWSERAIGILRRDVAQTHAETTNVQWIPLRGQAAVWQEFGFFGWPGPQLRIFHVSGHGWW